ncbi:hypothetical protein DS62_05995 [Smithella sp. SC_K08D17]|nr:hypothetical protein KD27_03830 [Smithella sp. D17]KIE17154.1 hypothetical protein DS62_05995 [Smithella sp. SC_K08D17]
MSAKIVNLILVLRCVYNPRIEKNLFAVLGTRVLMTIFFAPSVYALGFGAHAEEAVRKLNFTKFGFCNIK